MFGIGQLLGVIQHLISKIRQFIYRPSKRVPTAAFMQLKLHQNWFEHHWAVCTASSDAPAGTQMIHFMEGQRQNRRWSVRESTEWTKEKKSRQGETCGASVKAM